MAIATYAVFRSKVASPDQTVDAYKGGVVGRYPNSSPWRSGPTIGVLPTTSTTCVSTTLGALRDDNSFLRNSATARRVGRFKGRACANGSVVSNSWSMYDRLVHQAGLSGTVTSVQTTNLPTAPLSRYTSGVGVMMALEVYIAPGTVSTTFTVSYTNQAGVAGRISPAVSIGANAENQVGFFIIIPLQVGDTGVRSVESVTLAGSTGLAGNLGITLFKLLTMLPDPLAIDVQSRFDAVQNLGCNMPKIQTDACLAFIAAGQSAINTGNLSSQLDIIHE